MKPKTCLIVVVTLASLCIAGAQKTFVFAGNYTGGVPGNGIYVYAFDGATGALSELSHVSGITNPSFITLSADGRYLYACTNSKLPEDGRIAAFRIDSVKGNLERINDQPSGGQNPVYLSPGNDNGFIVAANYSSGSLAIFKTAGNGGLQAHSQLFRFSGSGTNIQRQEASHPHSAVFSPDFNYLVVPDLGTDQLRIFNGRTLDSLFLHPLDSLTVSTLPETGPRHLTFHPTLPFAYCIEELSARVSAYSFNNGKLSFLQRIFADSVKRETYSSADIHMSPDGRYLYASHRGEKVNTISVFSVDGQNGTLSLKGHQCTGGIHPRGFVIAPEGNFLLVANQVSGTIVVFKRHPVTGMLSKTAHEAMLNSPSCLKMRVYNTK